MSTNLNILYNIYANKIRDIYKDSEETITYSYHKYNYSIYNDTIKLAECREDILKNIIQDNKLNLIDLNIQLNTEEQKKYDAFINCSYYNYRYALDLYMHKLYLNLKDKNILRNNIINNYIGDISFFENKALIEELQLTIEEQNKLLFRTLFSNEYGLKHFIITTYDLFTNEHKKLILQNLLIDQYKSFDYIMDTRFPYDFRLQIFQYVFQNDYDQYYDLFNKYCKNSIIDGIRDILFKVLYNNSNHISFEIYWNNLLYNLQESELQLICEKYYNDIFGNKSSFNSYYTYCIIFGKWLHKSERMTLIQKLKTKTRMSKIPHALKKIAFDQDEIDILNSIILRDKLI